MVEEVGGTHLFMVPLRSTSSASCLFVTIICGRKSPPHPSALPSAESTLNLAQP